MKSVSIKTNAHIVANDACALYHLARSGAGLAIVPSLLADDNVASEKVEFVMPDGELDVIDVFAAWPSNAPRNGLIRLLIDALSKELADE